MAVSQDKIKKLLCSHCKNIISFGPVYLSTSGRNFCGRCKIPTDSQEEKFIKNTLLEELIEDINFPCKNTKEGCQISLNAEGMKIHETFCVLNKFDCPHKNLENCQWVGLLQNIEEHYKERHSNLLVSYPYTERPDITKDSLNYMIFKCGNFCFLFRNKCDTSQDALWYNVVLLAPTYLADLFTYTVKFASSEETQIKSRKVKPYNQLNDLEGTQIRFGVINELGDYNQVNFSLSISMENVTCFTCGQFLDFTTIDLADSQYRCLRCYKTPVDIILDVSSGTVIPSTETTYQQNTLKQNDNENLKQKEQNEKDKETAKTVKKRCIECNEYTDSDINGRCPWCDLHQRLKDNTDSNGEECENKITGCPYKHSNHDVLMKHVQYLCSYNSNNCNLCGTNMFNTRLIEHLVQKHSNNTLTELNEKTATVTIKYMVPTSTETTFYYAHLGGLLLLFHIRFVTSVSGLQLLVTMDCELQASPYLDLSCSITSDDLATTRDFQMVKDKRFVSDYFNATRLDDFIKDGSDVINIVFTMKIIN